MGGEGSIAGMIISLRNNAMLRRKKTPFEREKGIFYSKKDLLKPDKRKIEIIHLSEEQKRYYQKITIRKNRIRSIRALAIFTLLVAIITLFSFIGIREYSSLVKERILIKEEILFTRNSEEYNKLVEHAMALMGYKEWPMAIWQLKQAIDIFPDRLEAKLILADAYQKCCSMEQIYCNDGINFLSRLISEYPDNTKLIEMRALLYESIGQEAEARKDFERIGLDINTD